MFKQTGFVAFYVLLYKVDEFYCNKQKFYKNLTVVQFNVKLFDLTLKT